MGRDPNPTLEPHQIDHEHFTRFRRQLGVMDPSFKLLLDEMKSMKRSLEASIGAVETTLGNRIGAVESSIGSMERSVADRFGHLEDAAKVFDAWKPSVDESVKELRTAIGEIRKSDETVIKLREEMTALRKSVSRVVLDAGPSTPAGILPQPMMTAATSSAGQPVIGPSVGHHVDNNHRGFESLTQSPVKVTEGEVKVEAAADEPAPEVTPSFDLCTSNPEPAVFALQDDTLWTGGPGNYTNPKAPAVLSKVRSFVDNGKYPEATAAAYDLSGDQTQVFQPLGDIDLVFGKKIKYTDYKRELDLHTATVTVSYTVGEIVYSREHFSSNPHQVIATKISANKPGNVSFTVSLTTTLNHKIRVTHANEIIMEGSCPGERPQEGNTAADPPIGIKFCAILYLQINGANSTVEVLNDNMLKLDCADSVVLLLAATTSFESAFIKPSESKLDPTVSAFTTLSIARSTSYSQLKAYHIDDYQTLFQRVSLQLSLGSNYHLRGSRLVQSAETSSQGATISDYAFQISECTTLTALKDFVKPTVERIVTFKENEDPSLVELLFQFGRYLLISCSRPGTQISNLQGIWSNDPSPPWDAAPHPNINLQMNYWPALPCNLSECQEPLFDFIGSLSVNGAKTAKVNYGASGWVSHQVTDLWAKTSPDAGDPVWALWPMGGPWLATHLWEHYCFTLDKKFLEKIAYPLLQGSATFLLDWLIEGHGGYLESNPSTSPEHYFIAPDGKKACVSYSTTMDMSVIREVFSAVILSADIIGKSDTNVVQRIKKVLPHLPPTKVGRDGTIMEWAQDFQDPEIHHRHVSHLFGLYPGHTMSLEETPDLCKAVANSLYKRGDEGPGWSTSWKMALWARLHNGDHAYKMILQLITLVDPEHEVSREGGLYSNMFTAHPPFQIDANFGFPAALSEMLVQSTGTDLYLLPALPRNKWPQGYVKGLKARGGVTVNISWKEGSLHEALLWSSGRQNSLARLHYGDQTTTVSLSLGQVYRLGRDLKCLKTLPL